MDIASFLLVVDRVAPLEQSLLHTMYIVVNGEWFNAPRRSVEDCEEEEASGTDLVAVEDVLSSVLEFADGRTGNRTVHRTDISN